MTEKDKKKILIIDNGTNFLLFKIIANELKIKYSYEVEYITLIKSRVNYFKKINITSHYINLRNNQSTQTKIGLEIIQQVEAQQSSYRLALSIKRDRVLRTRNFEKAKKILCGAAFQFKEILEREKPSLVLGEISWAIEDLFFHITECAGIRYRHLLNLPGKKLRVAAFDAQHTAAGTFYIGRDYKEEGNDESKSYYDLCKSVKEYKSSNYYILKNIKLLYSNNDYRQSIFYRIKNLYKPIYKHLYDLFERIYSSNVPTKGNGRVNIIMVFHVQPESTPDFVAPFHADQIRLLEQIINSLTINQHLYLKEHPNVVSIRNLFDLSKLLNKPNVHLLKKNESGIKLLENFDFVVSIAGTALFEAAKIGIPAICYSNIFFNSLPNVVSGQKFSNFAQALSYANNLKCKPLAEHEAEEFLSQFGLPSYIHDARIEPEVAQQENVNNLVYLIHTIIKKISSNSNK